jgi:predicted nucleotidyltransferase
VNPPFITGSRVYGTPTEKSDIDLVCLIEDSDTVDELIAAADHTDASDAGVGGCSIVFGKLNLIVLSQSAMYDAWREATDELIARKPVTRAEACKVHEEHRKRAREWMEREP